MKNEHDEVIAMHRFLWEGMQASRLALAESWKLFDSDVEIALARSTESIIRSRELLGRLEAQSSVSGIVQRLVPEAPPKQTETGRDRLLDRQRVVPQPVV
jgi:hypothetical protein